MRREIETAISERRNVIPLFFEGFSFGAPSVSEKLTGRLGALKKYNGLEVPIGFFEEAMERLRTKYMDVSLDAVLHPVSNEVQKVVKEQQVAAREALSNRNLPEELERKAAEEKRKQDVKKLQFESPPPGGSSPRVGQDAGIPVPKRNFFSYCIGGIAIMVLVCLVTAGVLIYQASTDSKESVPTNTVPAVVTQNTLEFSQTTPIPSSTFTFTLTSTSTSTFTPMPTSTSTFTPTLTPTITSTYTPVAGSTKVSSIDKMVMVYVPAGRIRYGQQRW